MGLQYIEYKYLSFSEIQDPNDKDLWWKIRNIKKSFRTELGFIHYDTELKDFVFSDMDYLSVLDIPRLHEIVKFIKWLKAERA